MKAFGRVFGYVWPQWNRLLTIVTSVIIIAALYALSLATISPLLTVMMGEEGLHGWANRKLISSRCGLKFYISDDVDLSDPNNPQVTYYLQISKVKHKSEAQKAGLKRNDRIIGIGKCLDVEVITCTKVACAKRYFDSIANIKLITRCVTVTDIESSNHIAGAAAVFYFQLQAAVAYRTGTRHREPKSVILCACVNARYGYSRWCSSAQSAGGRFRQNSRQEIKFITGFSRYIQL